MMAQKRPSRQFFHFPITTSEPAKSFTLARLKKPSDTDRIDTGRIGTTFIRSSG
jgi:hypothetical protein